MADRAVTYDPAKPPGKKLSSYFLAELDPVISAALADNDTVANAAAVAVVQALENTNVLVGEELADDEFGVRFEDGDWFVRANETDGITSPVGGARFVNLPDECGWAWVIMGSDRKAIAGQRTDGSLYGMYEPGADKATGVVMVGDSLSAGWATYLGALGSAIERDVITIGIGAQTSPQIAARQGGLPALLTVSGNEIPANGAVTVTSYSVNLLQMTNNGTRTVVGVLCGVPGVLTASRVEGPVYTYTFTRKSAGSVLPCPPESPFQCGADIRDMIQVICVGRNNINDTPESIVNQVRAMVSYLPHDKYLVLSMPPKETEIANPATADRVKVDNINAALKNAFAPNWLDWSGYLISSRTLDEVGITPTTTDLQNIANGVTPLSLRSDYLHFNDKGYEAATKLLDRVFEAKGW